jgi:cardiolipin synthase
MVFSDEFFSGFGFSGFLVISLKLVEILVVFRALLRPHREPVSRAAWIVLIAFVPVAGIVLYFLFGETHLGRKKAEELKAITKDLRLPTGETVSNLDLENRIPEKYRPIFRAASSLNNLPVSGHNEAEIISDSESIIDSMVKDIESAKKTVHALFYIWRPDRSGRMILDAIKRAAQRGVKCRIAVDSLGSAALIRSQEWRSLESFHVEAIGLLPIRYPFFRLWRRRLDLRNHRKLLIIDQEIAYSGSRNSADVDLKPKYGPWVDLMIRFLGPVVLQHEWIFLTDWMAATQQKLNIGAPSLGRQKPQDVVALAFATGPSFRFAAIPEIFSALMFVAQKEIIITTPYYVPSEGMHHALCAAAKRGVDTSIVFPARNDSVFVSAASRSYYHDLLISGVKVYEYQKGLLHSKTFSVDESISLVGSANMDRRSFDLNFENNVLFYHTRLTKDLKKLQSSYLQDSKALKLADIENWSLVRQAWNNTAAILGPLL